MNVKIIWSNFLNSIKTELNPLSFETWFQSTELYEYKDGDITEQFEIKGNQLIGITIKMFGNTVEIARKLTWYEIVMAVFTVIKIRV